GEIRPRHQARHRRREQEASRPSSCFGYEGSSTRQYNAKLSELPRPGFYLDRPGMLFDNDVVTDGESKACALSRGLGGKEGVEHPFFHPRGELRVRCR